MSATMRPTLWVRPVMSARAARLGRYPSFSAVASTRVRVSGLTRCGAEKVRETVEMCTPDARATSRIVAGTRPPLERQLAGRSHVCGAINANGCATVNARLLQNGCGEGLR